MGIAFDTYEVSQVVQGDTLQTSTDGRAVIATGEDVVITHARATNESAATETFSLYLPNPTAAAGDANVVIDAMPILPGEDKILASVLGETLKPGTVVRTTTGTGSAINLKISITVRT